MDSRRHGGSGMNNELKKHLVELETYYRKEYERLLDVKPFAAKQEQRMQHLCGHIIKFIEGER